MRLQSPDRFGKESKSHGHRIGEIRELRAAAYVTYVFAVWREKDGHAAILWLLGVPIPVLLLMCAIGWLHQVRFLMKFEHVRRT
jgi:hypothetical protein